MRILVTGGAGYIGSHTVRHLLAHGHDVRVYDDLSAGHRAAVPSGLLVEADLADTQTLLSALASHRTEAVVHFAASSLVGESVRDPASYYRNNVGCSLNLLDAMRAAGVNRLVFSSTCATYGLPASLPVVEALAQNPINPYGNTKLAVERAIRDYAAAYGWGVAILRYFNAAGAARDGSLGEDHEPETHLIPLVLGAILGRRPPLRVLGTDYPTPDGTCIRDYVHVEDLAEAHLAALRRLTPGAPIICNIGTGVGASVRQVVAAAEEVSGRKAPVEFGPRREGDPPELVALPARAAEVLGWRAAYTDLKNVVETAWRWHKDRPMGYDDR